jgi:FtsZ-binding cell division protein ZapB
MFSQESKLAVLESKLGIYEDLSREMLAKLEAAVDKISEGNSRIATILAKHDERIEQSMKNDALLVKMIDEMKEDNDKEHKEISDRFEKLESKIEELSKFKWQIAGIAALAIFLVGVIPTIKTLTPAPAPATIESTK